MDDLFKDKKILITGGSGFIGSHLSEKIVQLGGNVKIFDHQKGDKIEDFERVEQIVRIGFDVVYHLSGLSGSVRDDKQIKDFFEINTQATENLCQLIMKYSPHTQIILSGSRLEYGVPQYLPVDEKHPTLPNTYYGQSKLEASEMALKLSKKGLKATVIRTSNVYGPHSKSNGQNYNIINMFIDKAVKNEELIIYGDGLQKRDYLYIDDCVTAFLLAVNGRALGQVYNLGYGQAITLKAMAELIIQQIGKGKIVYKDWPLQLKSAETGDFITDITKIKTDLGFYPKVGFEEGISKTIA